MISMWFTRIDDFGTNIRPTKILLQMRISSYHLRHDVLYIHILYTYVCVYTFVFHRNTVEL